MLTYDFVNLTKNTADLVLNWEKKQFPVKIEFAVDDIVMANAAEQLTNTVGFTWQGYESAAAYALQNQINYEQALKWSELAVTQHNSFQTLNTKAGLLAATGKKDEADKLMATASEIATEAELNTYGYQLLAAKEEDKAIAVFILNTQKHPQSANVFDSLGEAYALKGDKKNAIVNFKKSLSLNPPAAVKGNSEKYLKQLGAM
jgi:tetratricopeptide (TPR) repeat protein